METQDNNSQSNENNGFKLTSGRTMGGIVLLIVGSVLLARESGADLPEWLFSWPMIVIAVGVFIGAKHGFRDWGWLIPVTVGVVFLVSQNVAEFSFHQLWPAIVIAVGLSMILNSGRRRKRSC